MQKQKNSKNDFHDCHLNSNWITKISLFDQSLNKFKHYYLIQILMYFTLEKEFANFLRIVFLVCIEYIVINRLPTYCNYHVKWSFLYYPCSDFGIWSTSFPSHLIKHAKDEWSLSNVNWKCTQIRMTTFCSNALTCIAKEVDFIDQQKYTLWRLIISSNVNKQRESKAANQNFSIRFWLAPSEAPEYTCLELYQVDKWGQCCFWHLTYSQII